MEKPCSLLMTYMEGCLHPPVREFRVHVSQILPWDANSLIVNQDPLCWTLRFFLAVQTMVVPLRRGTSFLPEGICGFWGYSHTVSEALAPGAAHWVGRMQLGSQHLVRHCPVAGLA